MTRSRATADTQDNNGGSVAPFVAGKNKIINGDFYWNQRNFTSNTTSGLYNFDRWLQINGGSTGILTVTPQTFTPGAAPVVGYESRNFVRNVTASGASANTLAILLQRIEDVRTLANQTATISFWARAGSGTPKIAVEIGQSFGSGGSPSAQVNTYAGQVTISTSWVRYSVTVAVPDISGKTFGTNNDSHLVISLWFSAGSDFNARTGSLGLQNNTFDIWGIQVEAGSVATPFTTATGTIQGELAACQRYYYRATPGVNYGLFAQGSALSTTSVMSHMNFPVTMRTRPTAIEYGGTIQVFDGVTAITTTALTINNDLVTTTDRAYFRSTVASGLTQYRPYQVSAVTDTTAYIGFSAEL